jgi:hypothetical protein
MLAILLAAALAATPATDTVFTAEGGRVRGTVVEEGPKGVTVQLLDGTTRTYEPGQYTRIEYADGTVSTPKPPPPPPQPAPPVTAAPEPGGTDAVYFADGGRARGTVVEESPTGGVVLRLLDGSTRRYAPGQVVRIEYADGTVSVPAPKAAPPAYPAPARPPPYPPPAYPPPTTAAPAWPPPQAAPQAPPRAGMPAISPLYFSMGLGGTGLLGDAEKGVPMSELSRGQFALLLETGLRLSPAVSLGLYLDVGVADTGPAFASVCTTPGIECTAGSVRIGGLVRHTWDPAGRTSPWIAVGTAYEVLDITADDGFTTSDVVYGGWEMLRLMAGVDLRTNPVFGIGLYGGVAFGAFSSVEDDFGSYDIADPTFHTTITGGVRLTLFP